MLIDQPTDKWSSSVVGYLILHGALLLPLLYAVPLLVQFQLYLGIYLLMIWTKIWTIRYGVLLMSISFHCSVHTAWSNYSVIYYHRFCFISSRCLVLSHTFWCVFFTRIHDMILVVVVKSYHHRQQPFICAFSLQRI